MESPGTRNKESPQGITAAAATMYRAIPIGNKICAKRGEQRRHDQHREKIRTMKPSIDTSEPRVCQFDHIRNNLKREQMLEERYSEIDRENRILLQKMSDIMRQPSFSMVKEAKGPHSLNKDFRKKELIRITQENQAILKRIQSAQPIYSHIQWEEGHRRNQGYLRNSCEYPLVLRDKGGGPGSSAGKLRPVGAGDGYAQAQEQLEQFMEEDRKRLQDESKVGSGAMQPVEGEAELRYVLKEGKKIGESYYLVEMATDGRTLTISAYDGDTQQTLELLVNEKNHRKLYREASGDYSLIAGRLTVEGDRLLLQPLQSPATYPSPKAKAASGGRSVGPSDRQIDADEMVKQPGVNVELDVQSDGNAAVNLRGFTPSSASPSVYSGYN